MNKQERKPLPPNIIVDQHGLPWKPSYANIILDAFSNFFGKVKKFLFGTKKPSICQQILSDLDKHPQWEWKQPDSRSVAASHPKLNYELWFGYFLEVDGQNILSDWEQIKIRWKWDGQKRKLKEKKENEAREKVLAKFKN